MLIIAYAFNCTDDTMHIYDKVIWNFQVLLGLPKLRSQTPTRMSNSDIMEYVWVITMSDYVPVREVETHVFLEYALDFLQKVGNVSHVQVEVGVHLLAAISATGQLVITMH